MESLKGRRHTFFSYFHRHKGVSAAAKDITPISWGDPAETEPLGSHATFWVSYLAPRLAACMSQNWALANHLEWQELRFPAAPVTNIGAGSRAVILGSLSVEGDCVKNASLWPDSPMGRLCFPGICHQMRRGFSVFSCLWLKMRGEES